MVKFRLIIYLAIISLRLLLLDFCIGHVIEDENNLNYWISKEFKENSAIFKIFKTDEDVDKKENNFNVDAKKNVETEDKKHFGNVRIKDKKNLEGNDKIETDEDIKKIKFDVEPNGTKRVKNETLAKLLENKLNPIILIPGIEGSRLQATLSKTASDHYYCKKKAKEPFTVWINLEEFLIPVVNCFIENMRLHYNNETRRTSNTEGVFTSVPDFGDTNSIETLIGNKYVPQYNYFKDLVETMMVLGYKRNITIRGAPYDFRIAPNEQDEFFKKFINLIEETYLKNNKRKVILICHSMGCLYTMNLLNVKVDQKWKDRYISTLFAISSPWIGSIRALKTMVTGDNMNIFLFKDRRFKDMERTFSSIAFLLPNPNKFKTNAPVVITPSRNYTFEDYDILFERMNETTIYDMYQDTNDLLGGLKFPNVDMFCIYGTGVETERQLIYEKDKDFPAYPKKILYDLNGDSSVNLESLEYCLKWKDQTKYKFDSLKVDKGDHLDMIRKETVLNYLKDKIINIALKNDIY